VDISRDYALLYWRLNSIVEERVGLLHVCGIYRFVFGFLHFVTLFH